jgi:Domain of unknown function (DUF4145)
LSALRCGVTFALSSLRLRATQRSDGQISSRWKAFCCTSCGSLVAAKGYPGFDHGPDYVSVFPEPKQAHEDIPEMARIFLQQAYDTLHAPDAAAVMAGSAVDAMLKSLNYTEGSLYSRIDKAFEDHHLTKRMADWAHSVRLGSNRPRHADENEPHVSAAEARRSVDFAEALGNFLFVLTAQIKRGMETAAP